MSPSLFVLVLGLIFCLIGLNHVLPYRRYQRRIGWDEWLGGIIYSGVGLVLFGATVVFQGRLDAGPAPPLWTILPLSVGLLVPLAVLTTKIVVLVRRSSLRR